MRYVMQEFETLLKKAYMTEGADKTAVIAELWAKFPEYCEMMGLTDGLKG